MTLYLVLDHSYISDCSDLECNLKFVGFFVLFLQPGPISGGFQPLTPRTEEEEAAAEDWWTQQRAPERDRSEVGPPVQFSLHSEKSRKLHNRCLHSCIFALICVWWNWDETECKAARTKGIITKCFCVFSITKCFFKTVTKMRIWTMLFFSFVSQLIFVCFRDALNKMKDVYEKNPQMGDPNSLQPKISETMCNMEKLRSEIHKNEVRKL